MRKLLLLILSLPFISLFAQSTGDGCMNVRIVATQAWNEEYEDPFFNDESNWQWWFADVGNFDGAGWAGGNCLAQGGFFQIGFWNHIDEEIFNHTYGTAGPLGAQVPVTYSLRGHYEGDDCGGSCDYCTSFFDDDDYRYDQTVSTGINYRIGPPNQNNTFQRFTSNRGSSDFGGVFYARYTSPRPLVSANTTQICSGTNNNITLNFSGAVFGGNYVVLDGASVVYNGSGNSTTLTNINTSKTYNVYTSNGGVRSLCYSTITINAVNCDFNCVTRANQTWNASYDLSAGNSPNTSFSSPGNFPTNSLISDINVDINFLKTDGTCGAPLSGFSFHNETHFALQNSSLGSISLVQGNFVGNTALVTPITISFDEDVAPGVSGYNVTAASNGVTLNPIGNLDAWNWNTINPGHSWNIRGGDDRNLDPLCTRFYNLTVCGCKTANFGIARVNGSSSPITICADDPGLVTLSHNGATSTFDNDGYGDDLRWFSGSCGGTFVGAGLSISIPSPTTTTTYYASFYIDGVPCGGLNNACESITVNANPVTVPGNITPAAQTICVSSTTTALTLSGNTGSILGWEYSSDGGGTWGVASGSSASSTFSLVPYAPLPGVHTFRALVQNGVCDVLPTSPVTLTVNPNPVPGTVNAAVVELCSDESYVVNANAFLGDVQWQVSTTNGTTGFSNLSGETSPSYGTSVTNTGTSDLNFWYRVAVTNAPCATTVFSSAVQITINPVTVPGVVSGGTAVICEGGNPGNLSLTGHVGAIQNWLVSFNGGAPSLITNTNSSYAPGVLNASGTYAYSAVVQSGTCNLDTSSAFTVTVQPAVVVSISGLNTVCQGSSITLTANAIGGVGAYSYQWQRNGSNVGTNSSTHVISSSLSPATYNYTVIVSAGACNTTSGVQPVQVNPRPVISNITTQDLECFEVNIGAINIIASADSFSIDNGVTYQVSNNFTSLTAGNYNVFVKNTFGCITANASNPIIINQPDSISISFAVTEPNCATSNDGEILVGATGGTPNYEFAINGGSFQSGNSFINLAPGNYSIAVRDDNNCIYTKDTTLTAQYLFDLTLDSLKNVSCPGSADGYVELGNVGGVAPFAFSSDNSIFQADSVYDNLVAGSYTFYASDANGCTDVISVPIVESPPINIQLDSVSQPLCFGNTNAAIYISVSGSTTPYTFEWRLNGAVVSNQEDVLNVGAGVYNLTVTTSASCIATLAVQIVDPSALSASTVGTTDVTCNGLTNGSVQVSVTGGTPSYAYEWTDATSAVVGTNQNLSGVGAGTYTLTVTDANGCTTTTTGDVLAPAAIAVNGVTTDPSCANSNDGEIVISASGGTPPYSYALNGGSSQTNATFSGLAAGTYSLNVTDANGCTAVGTAILTDQYTLSLAVQTQTNVSCAGQNDGTVTLAATGGQAPFTYTINGSGAQASNVFSGLAPGLYNFGISDANGCSATTSTTITSNPPIVFNLDSTTNVLCNGQITGAIYVSATGGQAPLSYAINGGAGQASGAFTGLTAGNYNLTVTGQAGCTESLTVSITQPSALSASTVGTTDVTCNGLTNGSVQVSVTGGTPSYAYEWTDATSAVVGTNQNLSGVGAGTYTLTVTDANGCTTTTTGDVLAPAAIAVNGVTTDPSCANSNDGEIVISASGGTPPYSYALNGGASQTNATFSGLAAGTYSLNVTDANGCTAVGTAILTDQYTLSLAVQTQTNVSCAGQNDGTVTLAATGGQAPFTYTINGSGAQASNVFSGLAPGLYNFGISDANGCSATTSTTITSNPPIVFNLDSTTNVLCNGQITGAIYVSATGGQAPLSYAINGGAGQASGAFTGLAAGNYNLTVTGQAGCTESLTVSITQPSALSASTVGTTDVTCNGLTNGSVQVSVTGGTPSYAYEWTDATSAVVGTNQNLSGVGAGTYTLTVTDANGCTTTTTGDVLAPAAIAVNGVTTDPSCANSNDGEIVISASGGTPPYSYALNGGSSQTNATFSGLAAGTYSLNVTDANGCTAVGTAILTDQYTLSLAVQTQTNVSCAGQNDGTVTLAATGGQAPFTYTINGSGAQASNVFSGLAPGLYNFGISDANGCSATTSTTITSNPPIVFNLDSTTNVLCNGQITGAIYVSATGGQAPLSYAINGGAGQASGAFTGLAAGNYNLTVTGQAGCTESLTVSITQPSALSASTVGTTDVTCNGLTNGSVQVSVTGGTPSYAYEWTDATSAVVGTNQNLSGVGAGTYTLTVTDANGCTTTTTGDVLAPAAIAVNGVTTDPSCANSNDGEIVISASGGTPPYSYALNGGSSQTNATFSGLAAGTYSLNVTDANGCTAVGTAILTDQYTLSLAVQTQTNVSCAGQNDGTVTLAATGGQAPFTYTINGSGAQASNVFSGLAPGLYNFGISDANGCSATTSTTITSNPPIVFNLDSTTNVLCNGQSTGAIYVSATGGQAPLSYAINGGAGQASGAFTGLAAGNYNLTVTGQAGCTESLTVSITQPSALSASTVGTTDVTCNGLTNGSVQVSVTGGTPSYAYEWTDATSAVVGTNQNLSGVGAGTYTLTVTDANGCTTTTTGDVLAPAAIAVNGVTTDPSCANSNDGEIVISASGGTPPYSYALNGGSSQTNATFSGLAAGTYSLNVTDANGCTAVGTAILTDQYTLSLAVQTQTNVSCAGQNDGTVTLAATGGQAPFTYTINGSGAQASNVFSGLAPGLYNFGISDANGCSATTSTTITSNPPIVFNLDSTTNVLCNGQSTGAIYVSATGGQAPLSYAINGGAGQASGAFTGLAAGNYNLTVTGQAGCTESLTVSITQPSALSASTVGTTDVTCNGLTNGSVQVSVTGGTPSYAYEWTDATSAVVGTNQNLSGVGAGTYTLTVTDANGCTTTTTGDVLAPAAIAVNGVTTDPSCANSNDGEIVISASGGTPPYSYALNGGSSQTNATFSGLAAGTYSLNVTDANGCTAVGTAILTDQYTLSLAVQTQTNVSCAGQNDGTVTLAATGGQAPFTYTINGSGAQASNVFSGLAPGLYNFGISDANGCSATTSTTITSNPPIVFNLDSTTNVLCNGQSTGAIYVSATGGQAPLSYAINGGAGQASGAFTGLTAGNYNLTVTGQAGCTESLTVSITQPSALSASTVGTTDVTCNGLTNGSVQVSVTGGTPSYAYEWTDATSAVVGTNQNLSGVGAGTYTLTVTDANGCTTTTTGDVLAPAAIAVNGVTTDPSCANSNDGEIVISASGGTPPYSYALNGGSSQTNATFSGLAAGTYSLNVTDANGCTAVGTAILTDQYTLSLAVQTQTNVSCAGQNDGTVTLAATGGQAPFTYTINGSGAQASNVFSGLAPGLYNFGISDANGCSATTSTTITSNPPLVLSLDSVVDVQCAGANTGAIYISVSGGDNTYSFVWSNNAFTEDLINVAAGTYTVTVFDGAGCSQTISAVIASPANLSLVVANFSDVLCAGDSDGYVDVSVGGGVAPYTFSWSDGTSALGATEDLYNLGTGTYTLTVTDANGCTAAISQVVDSPLPLTGSLSITDETCFGDETGTATANVSGGTAPYTYLWSTFETTQSISGIGSGVISVIVRDANACEITLTDTVEGPSAALTISLVRLTNVTCFGGNNGKIETSISGGTAPYTIVWTPGGMDSTVIDSLTAGVYTMTVTDANGCVASRVFVVTQPTQIITSVSVTNPTCFNQETGLALIGASGGNPPYSYEWNTNPIQTGALANNLAGDSSYVVRVTDNSGCVVFDTAVMVNPAPMQITTTTQGVTCVADENGEVAVIVQGGNAPYTYQLNGVIQVDSVFENLAVGTYVVTVVDNNQCNASAQFDIVQNPVVEIDLLGAGNDGVFWADDLFIIRGEEVQLLADILSSSGTVSEAIWSAVSSANLDTSLCGTPCLEPTMMPEEDLTVTVNIVDTNGCVVTDTLRVSVSQDAQFFMPTAFSPNGDCLNDNFEINVLGATNLDVRIFNRWGEELFHNPSQENGLSDPSEVEAECFSGLVNPRNAWDGTYNGEPMPIGAYTYQVDITLFDGTTRTMSGSVTIIR